MNAFMALVRNDIGFSIVRIQRKHRYFWLYAAAAAVLWAIQYAITLDGASGFAMDPRFSVFAVVPVLFYVSGTAFSVEWRRDTAGWWLALPHPRPVLLAAKAVATWVKAVMLVFVVTAVAALLLPGAMLLRPGAVAPAIASVYIGRVLQLLALLLLFSPCAAMSGLLFRLIARSSWRAASPLIWFGLPTAFFYLISLFTGPIADEAVMDWICGIWANGFANLLLFLLAEAAYTGVLWFFSVYLLEKQIEL